MKREDFFLQEQKILMDNHNSEFYRSKMSDFNLTIITNTSQLGGGNTSPPLQNLNQI